MIERITLKMQAYNYLKKQIIEGKLKADEIYTEQGFAEMLNISRTPVREAVLQLAHEDFVTIKPNKGFMLRDYSAKDIDEYIQVRTAIEGFCGMYAADTSGSQKWRDLVQTLETYLEQEKDIIERGGTSQEFMKKDFDFHLAIVSYSNNSQMLNIFNDMRNRIDCIGVKTFSIGGTITNAYKEHIKIVKAIKNGNRADTYDALEAHLDKYREVLDKI